MSVHTSSPTGTPRDGAGASQPDAGKRAAAAGQPSTTDRERPDDFAGTPTRPPVRPTRQRRAVAAALADVEVFTSAQDVHALLRERGEDVGLTTVYRTLQALADAGEIDVLRSPDGESVYRRCSTGHHHHLVCRSCGRTVEIEGPAVESWADRVAAQHGFAAVEHTLEIFGTCADCA